MNQYTTTTTTTNDIEIAIHDDVNDNSIIRRHNSSSSSNSNLDIPNTNTVATIINTNANATTTTATTTVTAATNGIISFRFPSTCLRYGLRVQILEWLREPPIVVVSVFVLLLVVATVSGFVVKHGGNCKPDLKLWLCVAAFRSSASLAVRWYMLSIVRGSIPGNILVLVKVQEMLQVYILISFNITRIML